MTEANRPPGRRSSTATITGLLVLLLLMVCTIGALLCLCTTIVGGASWWTVTRSTLASPPPTTLDPSSIPLSTPILTPTPDVDPDATARRRHLRIFTKLWETVRDAYLYPDYNGADWDAIGEAYRARVEAGLSDEEFWWAMDDMLLELNDDHSVFLPPEAAAEEDALLTGGLDYVGIGIYSTIPPEIEKEYAIILLIFPDGPAERAGLRPHDHILTIDGQPACCDEWGYDNMALLEGPEGTAVELEVRTPGEPVRTVTVTRARIEGPLPVETRLLEDGIGYILIPTLWDDTITDRVRRAMEDLAARTASGALNGLVLDLRVNAGGSDTTLVGLLELFTTGEVGRFVSRHGSEPLRVQGLDVAGSQRVPLVVLVGTETASFAEVLAGVLQESGRASVVGRTTLGNVETTYGYDFEDGSRAWIAQETFLPPSGIDWEEQGIVPDVEIPLDWDEFTVENDPQLEAALELLRQNP